MALDAEDSDYVITMENSGNDVLNDSFVLNDTINAKSDNGSYVPHHVRPDTYIVPIIFALIFIVGTIGKFFFFV